MPHRVTLLSCVLIYIMCIHAYCYDILSYNIIVNNVKNEELEFRNLIKIKKMESESMLKFLFTRYCFIDSIIFNNVSLQLGKDFIISDDSLMILQKNNDILKNDSVNLIEIYYKLKSIDYTYSNFTMLRRENKWYPFQRNDISEFKIKIINPLKYEALSSGELTNDTIINFQRIQEFICNQSTTLPLFIYSSDSVKKYYFSSNEKIIEYIFSSDKSQKNNELMDDINESFVGLSTIFGNYTGKVLRVIEFPNPDVYLAQSLKNIIVIGKPMLYNYIGGTWAIHETAHQWWGQELFINDTSQSRLFLEETMTEFIKDLYIKEFVGDSQYQNTLIYHKNMLTDNMDSSFNIQLLKINNLADIQSSLSIYQLGPLCLSKVCKKYGTERIINMLHQFFIINKGNIIDYNRFDKFFQNFDAELYYSYKEAIEKCSYSESQ